METDKEIEKQAEKHLAYLGDDNYDNIYLEGISIYSAGYRAARDKYADKADKWDVVISIVKYLNESKDTERYSDQELIMIAERILEEIN